MRPLTALILLFSISVHADSFNFTVGDDGSFAVHMALSFPDANTSEDALDRYLLSETLLPSVSNTVKSVKRTDLGQGRFQTETIATKNGKESDTFLVCKRTPNQAQVGCVLDVSRGKFEPLEKSVNVLSCSTDKSIVTCNVIVTGQTGTYTIGGIPLKSARRLAIGGVVETLHDFYALSFTSKQRKSSGTETVQSIKQSVLSDPFYKAQIDPRWKEFTSNSALHSYDSTAAASKLND